MRLRRVLTWTFVIVLLASARPALAASDPYEAAQQGIDWLLQSMCDWMQTTGQGTDCATGTRGSCMGCHVQAETVLGLARSSTRCYRLPTTTCAQLGDESPLQFAARFVAGCQRKDCILGTFNMTCYNTYGYRPTDPTTIDGFPQELGSIGHYPDCGSNAPSASYHPIIQSAHGGLALAGYTTYLSPTYAPNLVALADWFVSRQDASGRWIADRFEAPVDQGDAFCTSAAMRALLDARPFATPAQVTSYDDAVARAMAWMRTAPLSTNQDKSWAILAYVATRVFAGDPDRDALLADLLNDQNVDGGWSERPGLQSNAYATGQALYALFEAGVRIDDPQACAGVSWLVAKQNADGSWPLGSRGVETDSSRESFFTATIWPVLALGSLRPWGANVSVPNADLTSCRAHEEFAVTVSHAADTACGLFGRPDTYDLSVFNALGDTVSVTPSSMSLASGESAVATITWDRVGGPRPAGTVSMTALKLVSEGASAAGCSVIVGSTLTVTQAPDDAPGALGFGLRVSRAGTDVTLRWPPHDVAVGGYELVSMSCPQRDTCATMPEHALLDASAPRRSLGPSEVTTTLTDEALPSNDDLIYYVVRAVSECSRAPGPTCNFACSDPRACWAFCR